MNTIYTWTTHILLAIVIFLSGVLCGSALVIRQLGPMVEETLVEYRYRQKEIRAFKGILEAREGIKKGKIRGGNQ